MSQSAGGIHKVSGGVHLDSLGFLTGLVRMELSNWSMVGG